MNRYFVKYYIFFFIIYSIFIYNECFAQTINDPGSPFIRNYPPKEYKGSSQNWTIIQDGRGVMYFGNNHGVLEFDGREWKLIEVSNSSVVRSLAKDRNGTIYVGASGEFGFLASDSIGKLKYISLVSKLNEEDRNFNDVWRVFATSHGIYFLTFDKIFRLNNNSINVTPIHLKSQFGFLINDRVFIIHKDKGLCIIKNDKPVLLPYTKEFAVNSGRTIILPYSENKIIIVSNNRFYIYTLNIPSLLSSTFFDYSNNNDSLFVIKKFHTEIDEYIINNILYEYATIGNNCYALATLNGGIVIMDRKGKLVRIINKNRGLQNNTVLKLFIDNNRNLWAALNGGISEIEISSPITKFNELNNIDGTVLSVIKYNKKIFAGTVKGIHYLPKYEMSITNDKYDFLHIATTKSICWDFFSLNNRLFATGNSGVALIRDTLAKDLNNIGEINCFGYTKKFPNHIFIGLTDGFASVQLKYPETNIINDPYKTAKIIAQNKFQNINTSIREIISDANGDLLLTTLYNGLIHLKFGNDPHKPQLVHYDTTNGLPDLKYNFIFNINDEIIVATQQGFYKAVIPSDYHSGDTLIKFVADLTYSKYFYDNSMPVYQIYADSKNTMWVNSDEGIGIITKNDDGSYKWNITPFKKLPNCNSFYGDSNGIIWFCSSQGLFCYDTNVKKNYNTPFHSIIRKVTLGKDSVIFQGTYYNDSLKTNNYFTTVSLLQPEQLISSLDYKNNSITFEFSASFYESESVNQFQYILEGFDKEWSNWTKETKKEYTNLHEGTYFFKVKAKNIYGIESTEAVYKFTISPPWYRTIVAYIAYVVLAILLIWLVVKLNTRRLKALNVRLEKIVKDRTIEIQSQKEEIQAQANELQKLSIVASETDNGVMIMDAWGNLEWINQGFTKMFGYTFDEIISEKGRNLVETSSNINIHDIILSIRETKKPVIYISENTTKSGEKKWVQSTITPILDNNNEVVKLVAIDSNISKLKKAEKEITRQRDEISMQKKEITDSIIYSRHIQNAILPTNEYIREIIPNSFILYKPKEIIGGDFYWVSEQEGKIIIAVADCTGHGVPGALMSMIGVTFLNEIVNNKKITRPAEILNRLRKRVIEALHQSEEDESSHDGMDIALCVIDTKTNKLSFAGANNPIIIVENNEYTEIKPDKMPISIHHMKDKVFVQKEMKITSGHTIFLFSDGFADQFNMEGKKFLKRKFKELLKNISSLPFDKQKEKLKNTFVEWQGETEQVDDVTVMGFKL